MENAIGFYDAEGGDQDFKEVFGKLVAGKFGRKSRFEINLDTDL